MKPHDTYDTHDVHDTLDYQSREELWFKIGRLMDLTWTQISEQVEDRIWILADQVQTRLGDQGHQIEVENQVEETLSGNT